MVLCNEAPSTGWPYSRKRLPKRRLSDTNNPASPNETSLRTYPNDLDRRARRLRPIGFPLRDSGGLCQIRAAVAREGAAESRAAGIRADQLAPNDAAFPLENEHRDHGVLDWRSSRRQ